MNKELDKRNARLTEPWLLELFERILEIPSTGFRLAMWHATDVVADALEADKVDAFIYDPARDCLVAAGSSSQPLSALQRKHGLDVLQISNGGRVVHVYESGKTFVTGHLDQDQEELVGIRKALHIKSQIGVPLEVGGVRRGVVMIASLMPEFFTPEDVRIAELATRWIGIVAHRAELAEQLAENAVEQGRRAVAEELITIFAHDLRNHLGPLQFRLELMRAEENPRAREREDLELVLRGIQRLGSMVSDILDVARLDQGVLRAELECVELVAFTKDLASTLSTPEYPIEVLAREDVVVAADPARMRQCLENLLANAVKHSPRGAAVMVQVSKWPAETGERARVEVCDEGPGVAPEMLPRLFERFARHEGSEGLGLGLYLAKRIAVLHDGDLEVESRLGKGTRFILTLPAYPPSR
jgi:two-component system, OmpR family, sensor kinase